jgi:hypothetical protein
MHYNFLLHTLQCLNFTMFGLRNWLCKTIKQSVMFLEFWALFWSKLIGLILSVSIPLCFINVLYIFFIAVNTTNNCCSGFYNDMFRLTWVIVRLCSEPFGFSTIVNYSSGGCWSVWSGGYPYTDGYSTTSTTSVNDKQQTQVNMSVCRMWNLSDNVYQTVPSNISRYMSQNFIHVSVRIATTSYRPTTSTTVSNNSAKTKSFWT